MPTIRVKVSENLTEAQRALLAGITGPGTITAASRAVVNELKDWFGGLETTRPNKQGFHREQFWSDIRKSVQQPDVASSKLATISITDGRLRQRLEGGYIRPTGGKKYLTIPAIDEAYGHRAREFSNLHFGFAENKYGNLAPALIENYYQEFKYGRKRKDGTRKTIPGEIRGGERARTFYYLVRQVFQQADPTVLPYEQQIEAAAVRGANEYAQALTDRANNAGGPN